MGKKRLFKNNQTKKDELFDMFDSEDYIYALADVLIQSNLQCIQGFVFLGTFVSSKHFMFMFLMATLRE